MFYRQKNAPSAHTSGPASTHHSGPSGITRPPATLQMLREEDPPENIAEPGHSEPGPFTLVEPLANKSLPLQPRFVPRPTDKRPATVPAQPKAASVPATPVVQRVIVGLEAYQDPDKVPQNWLDQYHADLRDTSAPLSKDQVLNVFGRLFGGSVPADHGMVIDHTGGDQWTLHYKGENYQTITDGNGGLHVVHLALRLLHPIDGAPPVNPAEAYQAPAIFVAEQRKALHENLTHIDNAARSDKDAQKHISHIITQVEDITDTGFGPAMQKLLLSASIRGNQENLNRFLDIAYAGYQPERKRKAIDDLPKPSVAHKSYQTDEFFRLSQSRDSLEVILTDAISKAYQAHNFHSSIDFSEEVYQREIKKWVQISLQNFRSPAAIKKEMEKFTTAYVARAAKKKRLEGNSFLPKEKRAELRNKLKDPRIRRKIMRASRHAVLKFKKNKTDAGPTKMISEGTLNFGTSPMSTEQLIESLHAFTTTTFIGKNDLVVGSGPSTSTSIGQGGLQVKGLGTYAEEMSWFGERIKKWNVNPGDLFRALMTRDEEQLKRLTKANAADMKHMLSFRVLQIEEIFRGMQFGIGVAAHLNLGFHGQADVSSHLTGMPMYAAGATTNVTKTDDWDHPHNPGLWDKQVQSTMEGIDRLVEVELKPGQLYNMNAQAFLQQLHAEPMDDAEPSEELIDQSRRFMMSPNPYINEDDDGGI